MRLVRIENRRELAMKIEIKIPVEECDRLARKITLQLTTNGYGEHALRLQLRGKLEKDLGGYCRDMVYELIRNNLLEA
jgi:hypothetical protein